MHISYQDASLVDFSVCQALLALHVWSLSGYSHKTRWVGRINEAWCLIIHSVLRATLMKVSFVIHVRYLQGASVLYVRDVDRVRVGVWGGVPQLTHRMRAAPIGNLTQRAMKVVISWPTFDAYCLSWNDSFFFFAPSFSVHPASHEEKTRNEWEDP